MMTRSRKKPGRGYNRTAWIAHHQEIVKRAKDKEMKDSIVENDRREKDLKLNVETEIQESGTKRMETESEEKQQTPKKSVLDNWLKSTEDRNVSMTMSREIPIDIYVEKKKKIRKSYVRKARETGIR